MSMVAYEQLDSRAGDYGSVDYVYRATGASDAETLRAAVAADLTNFPIWKNVGGGIYLVRDPNAPHVEEVWIDPGGTTANNQFRFTVHYARPDFSNQDPPKDGEWTFQINATAGSQHVKQSISTVSKTVAAGGTVTDFQGAIGVTQDREIEGVDIVLPVQKMKIVAYKSASAFTSVYANAALALQGKMNSDTVAFQIKGVAFTFAPYELLLEEFGATVRAGSLWELNFDLAISRRATNLPVGNITVAAKEGWDYLWVHYRRSPDAKALAVKPVQANVERVYQTGAFSALGLPAITP